MKPAYFLSMPFWAVVIFLLSSCGNNQQQSENDANTNDTTTASTTTVATETSSQQTIITTPQHMMIARQKVNDYSKWKSFYDGRDSMRLANGIHDYVIGRGVQDTNMVLVAMKVDDIAKARTFAKDPSRKQAMQRSGVTSTPTFEFYTLTFQDTARLNMDIRAMTTFTVKDWTTWQRSFDSGKQNRMQNGLLDRSYGHDASDSNKVVVVMAVSDSTKAGTYWNSNELKQRRARGGVISEPKRFVFRVVQRY